MALVRNITQKVEIPGEPGEWALIRKLSWKQLQHAAEARSEATLEKMKRAGGDVIGTFTRLQREAEAEAAAQRALLASRMSSGLPLLDGTTGEAIDESTGLAKATKKAKLIDGFDLGVLLEYGVANLSYAIDNKFSKEIVNDLDTQTAEFVGEEILKFSGVGQSKAEAEADEKNA